MAYGQGRAKAIRAEDVERKLADVQPIKTETYFLPDSFEWIKPAAKIVKEPAMKVNRKDIRINPAAVELLGLDPENLDKQRFEFGIHPSGKTIALRLAADPENSDTFSGCPDGTRNKGFHITAGPVIKALQENGWETPCLLMLTRDDRHGMLIARRPE